MNNIYNNPFRILGLSLTASEREIAKQVNKLSTLLEMGKEISLLDTDFPFLPSIVRTPEHIEEAKKRLDQSESKILFSLFWFWNNSSVDSLVFELLKEGNTEKAITIWEKSIFINKQKVYKPLVLIKNLIQDSTSWTIVDDNDHTITKNDENYVVEWKQEKGSCIPSVYVDENLGECWTIECDTDWMEGADNYGYGILFGRSEGSMFAFEISGNGYFQFHKFIGWKDEVLIGWTESEFINTWSKNHIHVKKINEKFEFLINGSSVGEYTAEPFFGNYFGFRVVQKQKITFKNFKFCNLIEDYSYAEGVRVTSKNYSSLKNLSILFLSLCSLNDRINIEYFNKGLALAKHCFSPTNIEEYSRIIAGDKFVFDLENNIHHYIADIIESLKNYIEKPNGILTKQLLSAFSTFPLEAKQFINNKFISKQIERILQEIENSNKSRNKSADKANLIGKVLVSKTKEDVTYLRNILGEADFQYQIISDKLVLEIVQCGVDYYNSTKNDENYLKEYEYAYSIAVSQLAKDRAKENLDSCREYIKNKHLFNCWFCGENLPEISQKFSITIYKENYRSYFPRRVEFSYVDVDIPRCLNCKTIHTQASDKLTFFTFGGLILGLMIGAFADGYWFAGLLSGGLIGWIIGMALKNKQETDAAIKDISRATIRNYPTLKEMLGKGWKFSKPTA